MSKVAVIGGGVAGITAAYALQNEHQVTILEQNNYLGGHTNTITVEEQNQSIAVDTGFIVCNPTNYPNFYRLLNKLGVSLRDSDMSFGFYCDKTGLGYTGPALYEFIKQWQNFFKLDFLKMLLEQRRFNRRALSDWKRGKIGNQDLGNYLKQLGCSRYFTENYLVPLGGAIWSSPDMDMRSFPAATFVTFFKNHAMLELSKRPRWQTVVGGSHAYVKAFKKIFKGRVMLDRPVKGIKRSKTGIKVSFIDGRDKTSEEIFDHCIIAAHADQALKLLADPSEKEKELLSAWNYQSNQTVLHTDTTLLPKKRTLWASWNYRRKAGNQGTQPVQITYYMNRLQGLKTERDYLVTLNQTAEIDPAKIIYSTTYTHPIYTPRSVAAQQGLRAINGDRATYFCGSYMGYGFHEDAVTSALEVASALGGSL